MAEEIPRLPSTEPAKGQAPTTSGQRTKERKIRREVNQRNYSRNEVAEADEAYKAPRQFPYPHSHAILRQGMGMLTGALAFLTICVVVLAVNYIRVIHTMQTRPLYLEDESGVTYRLRRANPAEQTKYVRDQIDEFVNLTLHGLYTYNPDGQPQIDLMADLVDPTIIDSMKKYYQNRKTEIFSKREIRTVAINNVQIETLDKQRGFATVKVQGSLIINSFRISQAFPMTWDLLIQLEPEIKSGPNVYGLVLVRLKETAQSNQ